ILITGVTLGELSFGPHATDDPAKRAGRVAVLQHVEATFDPLPYDTGAARLFGQICAAERAGRGGVLQQGGPPFAPLPYDRGAARLSGQICAGFRAAGREPRRGPPTG